MHAKVPSYFVRRDINTLHIYTHVFSFSLLSPLTICAPMLLGSSREKCFSIIAAVFPRLLYARRPSGIAKTSALPRPPAPLTTDAPESLREKKQDKIREHDPRSSSVPRGLIGAGIDARAPPLRRRLQAASRRGRTANGRGCSRRVSSGSFARPHAKGTSAIFVG